MSEQVVFANTVEGLFRNALEGKLTPRLKERVRAAGIDLDHELLPAYERVVWNDVLGIVQEEAFPGPRAEGMYALGRSIVHGFADTMIGKAVAAMARMVGPKRTLARMTKNLRSATSFNETRLAENPDGSFEVWINEPELAPQYLAGVLDAAVTIAGARGVEVKTLKQDAEGTTYSVRWRAAEAAA